MGAVVAEPRYLDVHRPRPAAPGDLERLRHDARDVLHALHADAPLGDLLEHLDQKIGVVHAVERLARGIERHRTRNVHHRRRRAVGLRHARDGVGTARPRREQAHAGLSGEPPVGVGHEGGVRLLLAGDEADGGSFSQRIVELQKMGAGEAIEPPDVLSDEGVYDDLARMRGRADFKGHGWTPIRK